MKKIIFFIFIAFFIIYFAISIQIDVKEHKYEKDNIDKIVECKKNEDKLEMFKDENGSVKINYKKTISTDIEACH